MALPRESRDLDATMILVGQVQPGMSLAVDGGLGKPQLFQVEKIGFSSKQQEDGSYLNTYTLTSGPTADGGPPWVIELPADATVCRILGYSATRPR
ncbi:hypothetical protein [Mycobacterium sp. 1245852.3]|uniref:hypothetical protein n=1 Tax=Mycobacterium sp. 1245852.3 TaxID=1856860 RepID=UPI0012E9F98D|nr:hypothetical protein [Mycobacterium sp. 1245852.3]